MNEIVERQIPNAIVQTNLSCLGEKYEGKVRDNYTRGEERVIVTTDRISCFDVVVGAVPFKGQVLNELAVYWFDETRDIIQNHIIASPHPNVLIARSATVLPVEVVVRGYLTGSAWRDYKAGNAVSGVVLPKGLTEFQKFDLPILTPSIKAERGLHDEPISEEEILENDIVPKDLWEEIRDVSIRLFRRGEEIVAKRGLILVDTKYEFGICDSKLILVDEIHTLDSSRYWTRESIENNKKPEMLDKEPVRQWLLERGFSGEGVPPALPNDYIVSLSRHYINSFERISGKTFNPRVGNVVAEIDAALQSYFQIIRHR